MSSGEKTEEATPRQLEKARERGEVSQSRDLTGAVLLATATGVIANTADSAADAFALLGRTAFAASGPGPIHNSTLVTLFGSAMVQALTALMPLLGGLLVMALAIPFLQVGALLSFQPLAPKFSKINPISGFKRMFGSLSPYIELVKSALKVVVVAVIFYNTLRDDMRNLLLLGTQPPDVIARHTLSVGGLALTRTAVFFLFIGGIDFMYQKWQYKKGLRMSKEDIKQEYKEQEGDPHNKAHRKALHEELSQESMLNHARKADVMVTNPEHIACALRYDPDEENAPRLLAKGKGYLAARLREIAKEEDIPIVRDVSLAHAIYAMELESEIPEELFDAVAELLKWVETVLKAQGETPTWLKPPKEPGEEGEDAG